MSSAADAALTDALLGWFDGHFRQLPWRDGPDRGVSPWGVLVSELMLQQTRVDTVVPRWQAWMARFPTPAALAEASIDDALRLWTGLGYYRRARSLHAAAQAIVRDHEGHVPTSLEALRALPGIGPYTAGAVRAIGHGQSAAAVDGNVIRVLTRLGGVREDVGHPEVRRAIDDRATTLAMGPSAAARPGAWTQALMELGALVCTPSGPACDTCPVAPWCAVAGAAEGLPKKAARRPPRVVQASALLATDGARVLLARRPPQGRWAGLWEPPMAEREGKAKSAPPPPPVGETALDAAREGDVVAHVLTHRRYEVAPHVARVTPAALSALAEGDPPAPYVALRCVAVDAVGASDAGTSRLAMRLVAALAG